MSFINELKRRNVVRVAIAYMVAAWVLLQIADLVLENIAAPPWVIQVMMLVILMGDWCASYRSSTMTENPGAQSAHCH